MVEVWLRFTKKDANSAKCKKCVKLSKCSSSPTSGMINHLKTHSITIISAITKGTPTTAIQNTATSVIPSTPITLTAAEQNSSSSDIGLPKKRLS